jgi:hypothetical protein
MLICSIRSCARGYGARMKECVLELQSMSDDNGQFLRCISKMEMKYDNTELDTPEMYNSIMVELY